MYDHWTGVLVGTLEIFCRVDGSVPSSHRFTILCWNTPISSLGKIRSLSNLLSRNLFLGNIPDTAWRMICKRIRCTVNSSDLSFAWHGVAHLVRFPLHHILVLNFFQPSGVHSVFAVQYLVLFSAGYLDLLGIGNDHIVTTVGLRWGCVNMEICSANV